MAEPLLVHARHGNLWAHPTDHYLGQSICLFGEYSELEYQFLKDCLEPTGTEGCIVEVGANAGYLSVPLSHHGVLIAFEPQPPVRDLLRKNFSGYIIPYAAGSTTGEIDCPVIPYSTPGNHGCLRMGHHQRENVKPKEYVKVPLVRLDDAVPLEATGKSLKLIKIDVEGMELQVLKGARELILRDLPILYLENDQTDKSQELIEYLWSLGYWCAWHTPPLFNPDNFFHKPARDNPWGEVQSCNMVCLPKGRRLPAGVAVKHKVRLVEDAALHPTKDPV